MKKFKIMLTATAAVMALSAVAAPMSVFATESEQTFNYNADNQTSDKVTVSYENTPTYTVTIPADVSFNEDLEAQPNYVEVNGVYLNKGMAVKVTVASANNYRMLLGGTDTETFIPYKLTSDKDSIAEGSIIDEVVTVPSGTKLHPASKTAELTYSITDKDVPAAGSYSDTLTFTIAVVDDATLTS